MNREGRRELEKRLQTKIKRIVELEKQIQSGVNREEAENEMEDIIATCTMNEMFAIEDVIAKRHLLENIK